MPVGAIIGAVGAIGGGLIAANGAKKAANVQRDSSAAQVALLRDMYKMNSANFQPEITSGNYALNQINALLGLPTVTLPAPGNGLGGSGSANDYSGSDAPAGFFDRFDRADVLADIRGMSPERRAQYYAQRAQSAGWTPPTGGGTTGAGSTGAKSPLDIIRSTPGYQFALDEGLGSLNSNANARGLSNSGATMKALLKYGSDYGDMRFDKYLGQVSDVANRGSSSKSALAGVSQNFANSTNAVNQNLANVNSQYAMHKAGIYGDMFGSIAGLASSFAGGLGGGGGGGGMSNLGGWDVNAGGGWS